MEQRKVILGARKATSPVPKKFYLESSGQLPVIKENGNDSSGKKSALTPAHEVPNNSTSTGTTAPTSDHTRRRTLVCSFAHDKPAVVEVRPFGKTFVGYAKEARKRKTGSVDYCNYFEEKERVNEKYKKILDEMKKEELVEIKHAVAKNKSEKLVGEIEEIRQKYEDTEKLIRLQEIMELEDLLKLTKHRFSSFCQPSGDLYN
eukprot:TRINITY_DN2760_c0_g1_i6.p1 TRINITY_DN2760_c0_g1~~TRINITY_DN2760_c0_g1_i6.p1  ORF type:complete len:203 (+),score=53.44 TRINITY_DN2760_c0_g1_i6:111-719(+)